MRNPLKRLAAGAALLGFLLTGALAGVGYAQARATTTTGVVTIRQIISGALSFAAGTAIYAPTGCTTIPYSFTGRTGDGFCSASASATEFYVNSTLVFQVHSTDGLGIGTRKFFFGSSPSSMDSAFQRTGTKTVTFNDGAGGAATLAVTGAFSASTGITVGNVTISTNNVNAASAGAIAIGSRALQRSPADGLWNVTSSNESFGVQVNTGTAAPTVASCGTGTVGANSRNTGGTITATGATACTVTFGAPAWTNTPHCVATDGTGARALWISGASTTVFTVNGLTSGDVFTYHCTGGV